MDFFCNYNNAYFLLLLRFVFSVFLLMHNFLLSMLLLSSLLNLILFHSKERKEFCFIFRKEDWTKSTFSLFLSWQSNCGKIFLHFSFRPSECFSLFAFAFAVMVPSGFKNCFHYFRILLQTNFHQNATKNILEISFQQNKNYFAAKSTTFFIIIFYSLSEIFHSLNIILLYVCMYVCVSIPLWANISLYFFLHIFLFLFFVFFFLLDYFSVFLCFLTFPYFSFVFPWHLFSLSWCSRRDLCSRLKFFP